MPPRADQIAEARALHVDLGRAIEALAQPETVRCGVTDPDPLVETKVEEARRAAGAPTGTEGCGLEVAMRQAYRCTECARWFHRDCAERHFEAHKRPGA